jgi:hypothetical protein
MKKILGIALLVGVGAYAFGAFDKKATPTTENPQLPGDATLDNLEGQIVVNQSNENWLYITNGKAYYVSPEGWAFYQIANPGYTPTRIDASKYLPVSGEYLAKGEIKNY